MLTPAHAADAAPGAETLTLVDAIDRLPVADEIRDGYTRSAFKHWNKGDDPTDGCDTRREVLIHEAIEPPTVGPGCSLTGGTWWSYYDEVTVTEAGQLDIDHMVPLAEAWDSGAHSWTAQRREAYANDQGVEESLLAVTGKTNRSKGDKDPADWLPPAPGALCRYLSEWTGTKLRWDLSADQVERDRLADLAVDCEGTVVTYEPVP
ncbi:HNH endonuclease family protein [Streptomyces xiamenensis]|uniref:HNH endonuclease family protein n=1 Tax=Streptomyces xiamenensis TaxID=408015 RepID=UPI0035E10B5B